MYLNIIVKTFVLYFFIIFVYRIMGKKEVGELSIVDLIVTILIAELAAICIEEAKSSILVSIVPIIVLVITQIGLSYLTMKNESVRNFVDGKPSVIVKNGQIDFTAMRKIRYSLDDLMSQLREKGIKSLEEVDYAVLENSGTLSVFQNTKDYPLPLILDGVIDYDTLKEIKKDKKWLDKMLSKEKLVLNDVFYAFYKTGRMYIITKKELL